MNLREGCPKLLETEDKRNKVSKNGPSKICGRQPLKKMKGRGPIKQTISRLRQILLGLFLNTWTQI